ncbi:MAG: cyclase/dehydrase [Chloroflexi bacterium]|nr:cyclase/dehydrase [Chloroflexota bacterium]
MYIENTIVVLGDWETIWALSSDIEKWPERLPHYRKVIIQSVSPGGRVRHAYMSCWRDILPVSWHTVQRLDYSATPAEARVLYNHVKGVTRGMEVIWRFEHLDEGVYRITISHDWSPKWPLVGGIASRLISQLIVHNIADKTLARVRVLAAQEPALVK